MKIIALVTILTLLAVPGEAEILFQDNFESGLGAWPMIGSGIIVADPAGGDGKVLSFAGTDAGGDIFSVEIGVVANWRYILQFDYLGLVGDQTHPDNLGGYIGFANGNCIPLAWLAGTELCDSAQIDLIDDGEWHTYAIDFCPSDASSVPLSKMRIMAEDWDGTSGTCPPDNLAGDVFFDNLVLIAYDPVSSETESWGTVKALFR